MSISKRQQILTLIDARLKLILTAGGYLTNAGAHVYPWLSRPVSTSNLLALAYRDTQENSEALTSGAIGYHRHQLTIEVEVLVAAGATTMETMRQVLADVITAIGTDPHWGGLAEYTQPGFNRIDIDQENKVVGGALITFAIIYSTKAWNPYL